MDMSKALVSIAALLALSMPAYAQRTTAITPAPISGYGTLSVATTSLALSTLTTGPNSTAFPTATLPNAYLEVRNSAASNSSLSVCPMGGTCTAAIGIPLAPGESKTWLIPSVAVSPTVISGSTATAVASW